MPYVGIKAYTEFSKATQAAQELDHALSKLLYAPNDETLATARSAWRVAYDRYLATLIYARLSLQDPEEWLQQGIGYQQTLVQLDAWPIEPGYIDYVPDYPFSGIVNDLALPLSRQSLLGEHLLSAQSAPASAFIRWSLCCGRWMACALGKILLPKKTPRPAHKATAKGGRHRP